MRYPRAFLLFNPGRDQLDGSFFQGITNSKRKVYLENGSKSITTIEDEISLIKSIDLELGGEGNRQALVLSGAYERGFIDYYFSGKNLSIYLIENKSDAQNIWALHYALQSLNLMRRCLEDACLEYSDAYKAFISASKYSPYPNDEFIDGIASYAYFEKKSRLEREVKSFIKSKMDQKNLGNVSIH